MLENWGAVDEALNIAFRTEDNRILHPALVGIDSGDGNRTDVVLEYVLSLHAKGQSAVALKGVGGDRATIKKGGITRGKTRLYVVGVDGVKSSLYQRLAIDVGDPGSVTISNHLPDEFYEGLTAEYIETTYKRGFRQDKFAKKRGVANEPLDVAVYNIALRELTVHLGLHKQQRDTSKPQQTIADLAKQSKAIFNKGKHDGESS